MRAKKFSILIIDLENLSFSFKKIRPTQYFKVKEYKNSIKALRNYAKEIIKQRCEDIMQKDSTVKKDLLSMILSGLEMFHFYSILSVDYFIYY